jgi:hypothetical protein
VIPGVLCPDIFAFRKKSGIKETIKERSWMSFVSHLDPKGGFSALMSCTDELSFGMRAGFPVVSKDIDAL